MKSFRTALLAAAFTAGIPALAFAQDVPQDQREHRGDRGDRGPRPDGGQRPDRGAPAAPPAPQAPPPAPTVRSQEVQRQPAPQQAAQAGRPYGRYAPGQQPGANPDVRGQAYGDRRAYDDRRGNDDRRGPPPGAGDRPNGYAPGWNGRPGDGRPGDYGRPGYGRPDGGYQRSQGNWRGADWRQDRRYDWRGYRDQNRSLFRGPRYVAPRGWAYGYRRFDIGFRLPPFLFGSQYWIADPWAYRLPPVDGPYRWVRYYNDVLLIDLRSGAVVDEIPDFFW
ncbi:Ni/Co efflux regulator RcnB [Sphingomonas vulcanisoli]|uniref:Ni/Co efflux regulator RcnB n=1 Tax=Sphingomonas vulcanisoli TaxID=1658060 RepID=A0ABX0TW99_9SPHN|nr:RcnB family protein [Sphingomonas vulcanisoli]NIJ08655.1 Ni/Co efflux regulator RcnB [Sphingomonas vulcanisoli]